MSILMPTEPKRYHLEIKPAIWPTERHKIEHTLDALGYHVTDSGQFTDFSACNIFFEEAKRKMPKDKQKSRMGRKRV